MEKGKNPTSCDTNHYCSYSSSKPIASVTVQISTKNIYSLIEEFKTNKKATISAGDIIIDAISKSLRNFSEFNSNFDVRLKIYSHINIGYLINLGKGTKTAVIKDADKKSTIQLSSEVKELALKYIHNELSESDAKGSTFSITNLASFKSYLTAAPIYSHQSSMISIASEFDSFEVEKEKIVPVRKFNLTLTYDARVASCQKAIQFLNSVKDILEGKETK